MATKEQNNEQLKVIFVECGDEKSVHVVSVARKRTKTNIYDSDVADEQLPKRLKKRKWHYFQFSSEVSIELHHTWSVDLEWQHLLEVQTSIVGNKTKNNPRWANRPPLSVFWRLHFGDKRATTSHYSVLAR